MWTRDTNLRCVATSFNSVLRAPAALSPPVEMKLFQSVRVVQRAPLDDCGGWGTNSNTFSYEQPAKSQQTS